jgi:hypothetical protein
MLRIAALAAALVAGGTSFALHWILEAGEPAAAPATEEAPAATTRAPEPAACAGAALDGDGDPRTMRAVAAALARRAVGGRTWLGKLDAVGGGRDTLVHVSAAFDPARPVELVIYMEGYGSFADDAMDHRHIASIARLATRGNVAYVAPDAPSSAHGTPRAKTPYWRAGCGGQRCARGHAAPGDFVAFLAAATAQVGALACTAPAALDVRVHLVGFSNGGKGVWDAVRQLADADFTAFGRPVRLGSVVFADANYGHAWLPETWDILAGQREAPPLAILVIDGERAGGNRDRARAFVRRAGSDAPGMRLVPLPLDHHGIGDAAVDYLVLDPAPAS